MKNVLTVALGVLILSACGRSAPVGNTVGMANPAAVFCARQGGKSEVRKDDKGNQYSWCHLPDGSVIEEWELYRHHHPQG